MPIVQDIFPSFNTGELSPRLSARVDFAKFKSGVAILENFIPLSEGGAMRRSGTRFIAEVKDSTVRGRLKRFEFSTTQAYVLELGANSMRFFRNQGQIVSQNITASVANGTMTGNITGWDDISAGTASITHDATNDRMNLVAAGGDAGHAEQEITNALAVEHVVRFRVYGAPGDLVTLQVGTTTGATDITIFGAEVGFHTISFTATAANFFLQFVGEDDKTVQVDDVSLIDNSPIELTTPWGESDLPDIEGPQSADILYQFHGNHPTYRLERRGHTTWSLVEVPWEDGPYISQNVETTTLNPSASTGKGITITASSIVGINGGEGFKTTDIGRSIRLDNPASGEQWGWAVVVGHTSTLIVTVDVKHDFATANATAKWRLGAWSETTGYPSSGAFFEQRLFAANTTNQPQTLWASQSADFELHRPDSDPSTPDVFDGTVEDDDAIDYTISADDVNAIFWMSAGEDTLTIGSAGGEWVPSSVGAVLTPSDISVKRQVTTKAANIQPVRIDSVILFVQRAKRKIKEFGFAFETDGFQSVDMTRLAQHITIGGVVEMAFAEEQESQVWTVRADGQLLSMTFRRQEEVVGWGRHIFGGNFSGGDSVCESVTTIPGADGAGQVQDSTSRDEVWEMIKRTIGGGTKRYVEMLERDFETGDGQEDSYYSDSLVTYDGAAATVITGLDHLEGETVKILADGGIVADKTVASGSITLDTAAEVVQVGLGFTHKLKFLRFEGGNAAGTAVGKTKRIVGITFVFLNSHTVQFGPDENNLTKFDFREVIDPMDSATPFFTGERFFEFEGDWDDDPRILIQNDDPTPFTLLAAAPEERLTAIK